MHRLAYNTTFNLINNMKITDNRKKMKTVTK